VTDFLRGDTDENPCVEGSTEGVEGSKEGEEEEGDGDGDNQTDDWWGYKELV
jgi:hypothetical protein